MKALRCLSCKSYVIVTDSSVGYCGKCNMQLQEDKYLNKKFKLEKDEPVKRKYTRRKKKSKTNKKTKPKKKIKKKVKRKTKKKK